MAIIARTATRRRFVPPSQRDEDNPFAVYIRPDGKDVQVSIENIRGRLGISDEADTEDKAKAELEEVQKERKISFAWEYLRIFLDGWENMVDVAGEGVEFERDGEGYPTDETIAKIPMTVRAEIFANLTEATQLKESERKNSG